MAVLDDCLGVFEFCCDSWDPEIHFREIFVRPEGENCNQIKPRSKTAEICSLIYIFIVAYVKKKKSWGNGLVDKKTFSPTPAIGVFKNLPSSLLAPEPICLPYMPI